VVIEQVHQRRSLGPAPSARSLEGVYKAAAAGAWFGLGHPQIQGRARGVELGGGDLGGVGDLAGVGEGLPGQRLAAEDLPPAFLWTVRGLIEHVIGGNERAAIRAGLPTGPRSA
jgi:hypothetical protein